MNRIFVQNKRLTRFFISNLSYRSFSSQNKPKTNTNTQKEVPKGPQTQPPKSTPQPSNTNTNTNISKEQNEKQKTVNIPPNVDQQIPSTPQKSKGTLMLGTLAFTVGALSLGYYIYTKDGSIRFLIVNNRLDAITEQIPPLKSTPSSMKLNEDVPPPAPEKTTPAVEIKVPIFEEEKIEQESTAVPIKVVQVVEETPILSQEEIKKEIQEIEKEEKIETTSNFPAHEPPSNIEASTPLEKVVEEESKLEKEVVKELEKEPAKELQKEIVPVEKTYSKAEMVDILNLQIELNKAKIAEKQEEYNEALKRKEQEIEAKVLEIENLKKQTEEIIEQHKVLLIEEKKKQEVEFLRQESALISKLEFLSSSFIEEYHSESMEDLKGMEKQLQSLLNLIDQVWSTEELKHHRLYQLESFLQVGQALLSDKVNVGKTLQDIKRAFKEDELIQVAVQNVPVEVYKKGIVGVTELTERLKKESVASSENNILNKMKGMMKARSDDRLSVEPMERALQYLEKNNLRDAVYELQQLQSPSKNMEEWLTDAKARVAVENVRVIVGTHLRKK